MCLNGVVETVAGRQMKRPVDEPIQKGIAEQDVDDENVGSGVSQGYEEWRVLVYQGVLTLIWTNGTNARQSVVEVYVPTGSNGAKCTLFSPKEAYVFKTSLFGHSYVVWSSSFAPPACK